MEYIKFKKAISIQFILNIISEFDIKYDYFSNKKSTINGIANGLHKIDKTLCFIENVKDIEQIKSMDNALILTNIEPNEEYKNFHLLYLKDARYVFIKILEYFSKHKLCNSFSNVVPREFSYISKSAQIHPQAILEENVIIEDDVIISAGCVIKDGTYVGYGSIIRENCTIGCDGIALYKAKNGEVLRFPHLAGIYIGTNVEIGANCVIVRGTLSNTKIDNNTVIGNLSNIGHGVNIGKKVWMSVGSLIGGNCTIGCDTTIGLGVRLRDNLKIGENVSIGMGSVVTKNLSSGISVFGNPAKKLRSLTTGPNR